MKSCALHIIGAEETYQYYIDEPVWHSEKFFWWAANQIADLRSAGFEFKQEEGSDFQAVLDDWIDYAGDWIEWATDMAAERDTGIPPTLYPALPDIDLQTGIKGKYVALVAKMVFRFLTDLVWHDFKYSGDILKKDWYYFLSMLKPGESRSLLDRIATGTTTGNRIPDSLNYIRIALGGILNMLEIVPGERESVLKKALLNVSGESLIDALSAVGLHITVSPQEVSASYSDE